MPWKLGSDDNIITYIILKLWRNSILFRSQLLLIIISSNTRTPGTYTYRICPLAGHEKIEATKVEHLLPPFTQVLFEYIPRSYRTGSWCKCLHLYLCGLDLSAIFSSEYFSRCLYPPYFYESWPHMKTIIVEDKVWCILIDLNCIWCVRSCHCASVICPDSDLTSGVFVRNIFPLLHSTQIKIWVYVHI